MKLLLLFTLLISGCSNTHANIISKEYDYSDVTTHIDWIDVFSQTGDLYFVYFYSLTCGHCKEIKQEVLSYYFSSNETIYFVQADENTVYGSSGELIGVSDVSNLFIYGTPFLIKLENCVIVEYYGGEKEIREYINKNSWNQIE